MIRGYVVTLLMAQELMTSGTEVSTEAVQPRSTFMRSFVTLLSGTAAAQLVGIALVPLIAWVYAPAAFGAFTSVWLLASSAGTVATLRFERAIPLVRSEVLAATIERLAWRCCVAILAVFGGLFAVLVSLPAVESFATLTTVFLGTLLAAAFAGYVIVAQRLVRFEQFRRLAAGEFIGVAAIGIGQLASGLVFGPSANALLGGTVVGRLLQVLFLANGQRLPARTIKRARRKRLVPVARVLRQYPLYSVPYSQLAVALSRALIFLAAWYAPSAVVGFIALAHRLTYLPVTTIANALRRVTVRYLSERAAREKTESRAIALFGLISVATLPYMIVAGLVVPWIIIKVLPPTWHGVAPFMLALVPAAAGLLISAWFDRIYEIRQRQRLALGLELGSTLIVVGLYWYFLDSTGDALFSVQLFSVLVLLYNLFWTCLSWRVANFSVRRSLRQIGPVWMLAMLLGVMMLLFRSDHVSVWVLFGIGGSLMCIAVLMVQRHQWIRTAVGHADGSGTPMNTGLMPNAETLNNE